MSHYSLTPRVGDLEQLTLESAPKWDGHITVTLIPEPIAIIGLTYIFQHNVSIALMQASGRDKLSIARKLHRSRTQ